MTAVRRARRDLWYWTEQQTSKLWHRVCADGVSCWLDWLPAFCAGRRYAAERALNPDLFTSR